jgi:hypothetical protein
MARNVCCHSCLETINQIRLLMNAFVFCCGEVEHLMLIDAYYGRLSQETLKGFSGSVLYQETLKNL